MRANLTAPALATWLVVGAIICIVWPVPWYFGALGGLAAAILVYWFLLVLEPKRNLVPDWAGRGIASLCYATLAFWMYSQSQFFAGLYTAIALLSLLDCLRAFRTRNQTETTET